jgi:hypothetical protein
MDAMGIAEEIAPLFKSKITDKFGNMARYVSVHTIDFTKKAYEDLIEYDLDIHIFSDQGELYQSVIIREYADANKLEIELARYRELVSRCLLFPDIDPNPLVKVDKDRNLIILERVEGFHLKRLIFSPQLKNYIFGRIYGVLHGTTVERLDDTKIRKFMQFLLQHLPFTDEEKRSISTLLENHLLRFTQNFGGFDSKILLRRKNIRFQVDTSIKSIDKEMVKTGDVIHASLLCEPPDELTKDRMRDMAFYFHKKAFNEFVMFGNLESTVSEMKDFFEGYSSALEVLNLSSLREMYISGITLNVELVFVAWLFESERIQIGEFDPHGDRDVLRYTYFLLTEKPFENIF